MTLDEIKSKIQYGDYVTLGQMLGVPQTTAKMRFLRGDEEAKIALEKIIEGRKTVIEDFQNSKDKPLQ
jgi:hypothetical protein